MAIKPGQVASISDQIPQQAHQPSSTRHDQCMPGTHSSNTEHDLISPQGQPIFLEDNDAIAPDDDDPSTEPYGVQTCINKHTFPSSVPSGFKSPMIPKPKPSHERARQESSYFGDFSFDQPHSTAVDTSTIASKSGTMSIDEPTITSGRDLSNKSPHVRPQSLSPTKSGPRPGTLQPVEPLTELNGSDYSATISSNDSSRETDCSRVSTFGRWFSKGAPDLRMLKFAKERRDSLRKRQEAEPPPPEPSPRITSFYHKHEYDQLQRERERQRELEEHLDPKLDPVTDEPLKRQTLLRKTASSVSLATAPSTRLAVVQGTTKSSRSSNHSASDTPPPRDSPTAEIATLVDQGPATPAIEHNKPFWQPRRRLSNGFSHSMMEGAQLARSRRTFRDPSSDNSDKSSKYQPSPRRFPSPQHLQPPSSPSSSGTSWFRPRRPRMDRYHSSEHSPRDTSERAMDRPGLKTYQSFPAAARNSMEPPNKAPTFLPSEARRVNTPPLITTTHEKGNKVTGYFWDFWYSDDDDRGSKASRGSPDLETTEYRQPFPQPKVDAVGDPTAEVEGEKDWYRVRLDRIMDEDEPRDLGERKLFDWDIPDHLPSSPLCPLHTKYRGHGKRVCVYHGRRENSLAPTELDTGI